MNRFACTLMTSNRHRESRRQTDRQTDRQLSEVVQSPQLTRQCFDFRLQALSVVNKLANLHSARTDAQGS